MRRRDPYRRHFRSDLLFAAIYGVGVTVIHGGTLAWSLRRPGRSALLAFIPMVAAAADLIEVGLLFAVAADATGPDWQPARGLLGLAQTATAAKFVFLGASLVLIAFGAVALGLPGHPTAWAAG